MIEKTKTDSNDSVEDIEPNDEDSNLEEKEIDEQKEESETLSPPKEYTKKQEVESEEIEEDFIKKILKDAIVYLDGRSRTVVSLSLIIFVLSIPIELSQNIFDVVIRLSKTPLSKESGKPEYVLKCPKEKPPPSFSFED